MAKKALMVRKHRILPRSFYARKTDVVAQELLGKLIVRKMPEGKITVKIVETEAYFGNGEDPASHAFNGPTRRSAIMFGEPGTAYVYFTYGMHWLLNFVAKEDGKAGAVLIRAAQPVQGIDLMLKNRKSKVCNLTNGPAKLTSAMAVNKSQNGKNITNEKSNIYVVNYVEDDPIIKRGKRVGINKGKEKELRFYIKNNAFVSVNNN